MQLFFKMDYSAYGLGLTNTAKKKKKNSSDCLLYMCFFDVALVLEVPYTDFSTFLSWNKMT